MRLPIIAHNIALFSLFIWTLPSVRGGEDIVYRDTFELAGANTEHLSQYVSYWIDSSKMANVPHVDTTYRQGLFKHWPLHADLNIGLNPYPLWLHLNLKHISSQKRQYWWSLYNQADSVFVFQKNTDNHFICTDTLSYTRPIKQRKVYTRFQAIPLVLDSFENRTLFVKVINLRTPQFFVTDLTTPQSNLLWERDFYWSVGIFAGCFLFVVIGSFLAAIVARERIMWVYGCYVLTVVFLLMSQELLITILPDPLFFIISRIHPLLVAIVGLALYVTIVCYLLGLNQSMGTFYRYVSRINRGVLVYGLLSSAIYSVFYESLTVQSQLFTYVFYLNMGLVLAMLGGILGIIILAGVKNRYISLHFIIGIIAVYFNPANYYLNYEGLINYYPITYPNYFYLILCMEFAVFGILLAWRYRKTIRQNYELLNEKTQQEKRAYIRELQIQEEERLQIARDLHDDLGATLSAIKLVTTNSYAEDNRLTAMVAKANSDLRHFFSKLTVDNLKERGIVTAIAERIEELNANGRTKFSFISIGDGDQLPDDMLLPLYRVVSELLSNILKHAKATEGVVQLIVDSDSVQLLTEDNGIGYDIAMVGQAGMGLRNIQDRVVRLGGEIHISSSVSGTTSIITVPL